MLAFPAGHIEEKADMKSQLAVVGLGGSLAEHSSSLAALRIALEGAAEAGAKTDLLDIRQMSLPM